MEFSPGDLVVHRDHGIGRFMEMRRVAETADRRRDGAPPRPGCRRGEGSRPGWAGKRTRRGRAEHEYMVLEYADGDRLFVPVEHLDRIDRYAGGSDSHPGLSRLGTGEWERTKRRVRSAPRRWPASCSALYSRREAAPGHAFSTDWDWQRELEAAFPFEETPDQELVLEDIKRDMEASRPMDRVVCGDVGFGKTELALRAAFKAVAEGRQVAVLVPTTVLCQQHFLTFTERLRPFPVTVRQLSRFCTEEEQRATLLGLRTGTVDIVIGTHRLLQRDVEFRNLGLVVIDEEQRFGVLQKERLKELRVTVDVLSLSATPIPRTLHMALAGIRDISVIQTPPEERQPIRTYVTAREDRWSARWSAGELARGGQVFYVHNRVQTIDREAELAAQAGARGPHRRRPRPDARGPAGGGDARLHRLRGRRAGLHHHHRERVSTSPTPTPSSSTTPTGSAWPSSTSCADGSAAPASAPTPTSSTRREVAHRARRQAPGRHRRASGPGGGIQAGDA